MTNDPLPDPTGPTPTTTGQGAGSSTGGSGQGGGVTTTTTTTTTTTAGQGGGTCYNPSSALQGAGDTSATYQGACSAQDIDDMYECAFGGTDPGNCESDFGLGQNGTPDAPKFACTECILPVNLEGPITVVNQGMMFGFLNTLGCSTVADGFADPCPAQVTDVIFCAQSACEACADDATTFGACLDEALADTQLCGGLPLDATCNDAINTEEINALCTGDDFEGGFKAIAAYFCGDAP